MHTTTKTGNGYTVTTLTKPGTPLVKFYLSIDLHDWRDNMPYGALDLYTDLLLRGAGPYSKSAFSNELATIGATLEVDTSMHFLTFELSVTKTHLKRALALFETMITAPLFKPAEFAQAKQIMLEHIRSARENSKQYAEVNLNLALYDRTERWCPVSHDQLAAEVTAATIKDVKTIHKAVLPRAWQITVGGDSGAIKTVLSCVAAWRIVWPLRLVPAPTGTVTPPKLKQRLITAAIPSRQNIDLAIGQRISLSKLDPEYPALAFGIAVLGNWGGFAGRLMSTVREKEGLTYGIYCRLEGTGATQSGHLRVMTFFSPQDTEKGLTSTFREIKSIIGSGITEAELTRFRDIIATAHILTKDSLLSYIDTIHVNGLLGINPDMLETLIARISALTREEVNAALKKHLDIKSMVVSAAGPTAKVEPRLRAFVKTIS